MGLFLKALQLRQIAKALLDQYGTFTGQGKLDPALVPSQSALETALNILANGNYIKVSDPAKITLNKIKDAVVALQGELSNQGLGDETNLGVLGLRTLGLLNDRGVCRGELQHTPSKTAVPTPEEPETDLIRWFYVGQPPIIDKGNADHLLLIRRAMARWVKKTGIDIRMATKKEGANVLIFQEGLDGKDAGVVADAHVGPPDGMQLSLRLDTAEVWTEDKFVATICHEMGHILGLDHAPGPGELMSPTYQKGFVAPTDADIARLRKVGSNYWKV